jgi:hypothetical protein
MPEPPDRWGRRRSGARSRAREAMMESLFKWLRTRLRARRIAAEDPDRVLARRGDHGEARDDLDPIAELVRIIGEREVGDRRPRADAGARRKQPRRR